MCRVCAGRVVISFWFFKKIFLCNFFNVNDSILRLTAEELKEIDLCDLTGFFKCQFAHFRQSPETENEANEKFCENAQCNN